MHSNDTRQMMARLTSIICTNDAMIKADPFPTLTRAYDLMAKQHNLLLRLYDALNDSDLIFDEAKALNVRPENFQGEALVRVNKANNLLREYFK